MTTVRKLIRYTTAALVILAVLFVISIPIVNNITAVITLQAIEKIPLPESTEHIESISCAGKLTGNGNGMQYFGAVLVKSGLSEDELDRYYSAYRKNEWQYIVGTQTSNDIAQVEHTPLKFGSKLSHGDNYYIIYTWGTGITPFSLLDIRGH